MYCHRCGKEQIRQACFCTACGTRLRNTCLDFKPLPLNTNETSAICHYFESRFTYDSIVLMLDKYHGIKLSLRTLKRRLRAYGLNKKSNSNENIAHSIIVRELTGPSSLLGYRGMWNLLRNSYGIQLPRDQVMHLLKDIDPEGTKERKARKLKRREYKSAGYCIILCSVIQY